MTEEQEIAFRKLITDGTTWMTIPAQPKTAPAAMRPPLPYVTTLLMDTWHIGIPYPTREQGGVTVHAGSLYSVQFLGPGATEKAPEFSAWVRGPLVWENANYRDSERELWRPFYVRECSSWKDTSGLVNGRWEERALLNIKLEHRITVAQSIEYLKSGDIRIYYDPETADTPPARTVTTPEVEDDGG